MNVDSTPRSGCSWARLRAAGDPGGLPGLVGRMLGAVDGESAREASGRIESNVCPNRMLYGAAEAVVAHIVSALGSGGEVSERPDPDPDASARRAGPWRVECAVVRLAGDDGPDDAAPPPRR